MMKKTLSFIAILVFNFTIGQTFTWNALGTASPQVFPKTHSTTVGGVTMSVNITSNKNGGSAGATYGAASQIGGVGVCAGTSNGLFLEMSGGGTSWTNSITVDITFSTPVTGPVTFTAYDINEAIWFDGSSSTNYSNYCDQLTVSGTTDGATAISGSSISFSGCSGTSSSPGATSNFVKANYSSNNCNCAAKTITIGANCTQKVKTIRLVYANGAPTYTKYGISQFQNIVISSISANNAANPVVSATPSPSTICSGQSSNLTANCTSNCTGISYSWTGGTSPTTGASVSASPTTTTNYIVTATNSSGCTTSQALTVNVTCALPVSLSLFEANCYENTLAFKWITQSEENNDYFILQGSEDGLSFDNLGQINGAGNSQNEILYLYEITRNKHLYFRLKQVDIDGTITYSKIISLTCDDENKGEISFAPNPFSQNVNLSITLMKSSNVHFEIIDQQGNTIDIMEKSIEKGTTEIVDFLPSQLEQGIYFVRITDEINLLHQSVKIVKL